MPLIVDHRRCKDRQSINMATNASPSEKTLHLVGVGVGHSIAPTMHNHITKSLVQLSRMFSI
jgi:shikimate 5-dehydrogenase